MLYLVDEGVDGIFFNFWVKLPYFVPFFAGEPDDSNINYLSPFL